MLHESSRIAIAVNCVCVVDQQGKTVIHHDLILNYQIYISSPENDCDAFPTFECHIIFEAFVRHIQRVYMLPKHPKPT